MTPETTGPDGRDVDLGVEQLPHSSQENQLHTQSSTHPVTPARTLAQSGTKTGRLGPQPLRKRSTSWWNG